MIKKALPFLIAIFTFLITSCGTSAPQNSYATQMEPAIDQLEKWQSVNADLEGLLTDPQQSSTGIPRIQIIELYNLATEYKITRDDYASMGFLPLDILVGDAHKITTDGHKLLDTLSGAAPVPETKAAHQAVVKCIQERVAFAEELETSLKELSSVDLNLYDKSSDCSTLDANLQTLTAYVNANK
jgi:hypothetical protein